MSYLVCCGSCSRFYEEKSPIDRSPLSKCYYRKQLVYPEDCCTEYHASIWVTNGVLAEKGECSYVFLDDNSQLQQ